MTGPAYPTLPDDSLRVLAHVREVIAEAKAAGRWDSEPVLDTDRFDGPIGADNAGTVSTYRSIDDVYLAANLRHLQHRAPGLFE